jgi:hypothetical protein
MLFREKAIFIERTILHTQVHPVGSMQSFSMLKHMVRAKPFEFRRLKIRLATINL